MPEMSEIDKQIVLMRAKTRRDIILATMGVFTLLSGGFMYSVHGEWDAEHMTLLSLIIGYAAGVWTMGAAFFYGSKEKE